MVVQISVLAFEECPFREVAKERFRAALAQERMTAAIAEVEVGDPASALELRFLGSPSIRVDGLDVEPSARAATGFGLTCRRYRTEDGFEGAPSVEMIRAALRARQAAAADRAVPIACSLSNEDARNRLARWNSIVVEAKISARSQVGLIYAEFRNDAEVRRELELLVAAERVCCPFLQFEVGQNETAVNLTVTSPNADAAEDLKWLAPALGIA